MDFDSSEISSEYDRCIAEVNEDPYAGRNTVGIHEVLRAHFLICDYFFEVGHGLGGIGPKSLDLLHSAIYRQFVSFEEEVKWKDPFDLCATLLFGIIKDHPFHDANKRTAFLVALYHLEKFGRCIVAPQREFEDFAVMVAESRLAKFRRYKSISEKDEDPEVRFISSFFRRKTRAIDKRFYTITYHQLNGILHGFKFGLENPHGNRIDVVRYDTKKKILGIFGKPEPRTTKVAQIGFPGWKSQVGKGAISTVRKSTGLTPENGYDSQSFYQDSDSIPSLISQYHGPLRRLADR